MASIPLNNLDQSEVGNLKAFIFGIISYRYYQFWMLSTVATSADAVVNHHWQRLVVILFAACRQSTAIFDFLQSSFNVLIATDVSIPGTWSSRED